MHDVEHNGHSGDNTADGDYNDDYYVDDDDAMMVLKSMMGL